MDGEVIMPRYTKEGAELYFKTRGVYPPGYPRSTERGRLLMREKAGTLSPADSTLTGLKTRAAQPPTKKPYDASSALADTLADATLRGDVKKVRGLQELMRTPKVKEPATPLRASQAFADSLGAWKIRAAEGDPEAIKKLQRVTEATKPPEKPKVMTKKDYEGYRNRRESLRDKLQKVESLIGTDLSQIKSDEMKTLFMFLNIGDASPETLENRKTQIEEEIAYNEGQIQQWDTKELFKKVPDKYKDGNFVIEDETVSPPVPYIWKNGKWTELERTQ